MENEGRKIVRTRSNDGGDDGGGGSWFKILKKFLAGFDYDERMCNFGSCGGSGLLYNSYKWHDCDREGYSNSTLL